ncbi:hypothetical protein [Frondihabitans australicus]|uniref:HEPN domain-containing protein n=1 Tax=Frondihabitans australicus TaxID=386892 RepID=A0A495IC61_9MICO|nr:hypothetical protein [Frondihabitans australicus]RKR73594.1 hypothetical protein C8E83_0687 [Frondihabitans australicus]
MTPQRSAGRIESDGRLRKARQFADAAALFVEEASDDVGEFGDAYVTLAVHSGIASADVISIETRGDYSPTGNHQESVDVLRRSDPQAARHLSRLLEMKTKAGYTYRPVSADDVARARRAHEALLVRATAVRAG